MCLLSFKIGEWVRDAIVNLLSYVWNGINRLVTEGSKICVCDLSMKGPRLEMTKCKEQWSRKGKKEYLAKIWLLT